MTLLPHMFFAAAYVLLLHMYTAHVKQFLWFEQKWFKAVILLVSKTKTAQADLSSFIFSVKQLIFFKKSVEQLRVELLHLSSWPFPFLLPIIFRLSKFLK